MLRVMEEQYQSVAWELPDDFDSKERYLSVLERLDKTSSPGIPYVREAPTIGEWLQFDGISYSPYRVESLWHDVKSVLQNNFEFYLRAFIKMEPHKKSKVSEKRWRLIFAFPLATTVVWHMLFDYMNDMIIENTASLPSQQGLKLSAGHWKFYYQQWVSKGFNVGLDKGGWDWTFPYWMLIDCLELRTRLARGTRVEEWRNIANLLYTQAYVNPRIVLEDGTIWQQTVPGIQKSGSVNTISDNGLAQQKAHIVVCLRTKARILPLPATVGDDSLHRKDQVEDLEPYRDLGIIVKSASEGLEFVGHDFLKTGPQPVYLEKHWCKLMYTSEEILPQVLDSMLRMYVHSPHYSKWEAITRKLGLSTKVKSRAYYLDWYDNAD